MQILEVGDTIPDGPPGTAEYVVVEVDTPRALVLRSTTHVPRAWREFGAEIDWTWSFRLIELPAAEHGCSSGYAVGPRRDG